MKSQLKFLPAEIYNRFREWLKVDLKLSSKGLILVFVPMAVVLIILTILVYLLNEAEYNVWQEADSKMVITKANDLSRKFINIGQITDSDREAITDKIQSLKKLALDNPSQAANIERLEQLANKGVTLSKDSKILDAAKTRNLLSDLNTQIIKIEDEEQEELNKNIVKDSANQSTIRQGLYLGLILNVALALLNGHLF